MLKTCENGHLLKNLKQDKGNWRSFVESIECNKTRRKGEISTGNLCNVCGVDSVYKIMIIEDDITIAKTIKEHLSKWDYDAIYVTDFRDIIRQFIQFQPHLVLIDVILPF